MGRPKTIRPAFAVPAPGDEQLRFWRWKAGVPEFVYVIRGEGDEPIKVGKACDVYDRMAELQTGNPRQLELLHVIPGGLKLEGRLHEMLARKERLIGEWFDGPGVAAFLDFIENLGSEMIVAFKQRHQVPDYRSFSPWREQIEAATWTERRPAA